MESLSHKMYRMFFWPGIFAMAMGFLEAIVVVYLRQVYYPLGFDFPLTVLSAQAISVEWLREISTVVMLVSVAAMAGKNNLQKLLYFLYCFAVWDIFYYVGLKIILDWPSSLLTWDILFLIPVTWIGPVLAPVICSVTMIVMSVPLIWMQETGFPVKIKPIEWALVLLGALIIFFTFIMDYSRLILENGLLTTGDVIYGNEKLRNTISAFKPDSYNWYLFASGELLIILSLIILFFRIKRNILQDS